MKIHTNNKSYRERKIFHFKKVSGMVLYYWRWDYSSPFPLLNHIMMTKSISLWGLLHCIRNRFKVKDHNSWATHNVKSRWYAASPCLVHIKHLFTITIPLVKLLIVNILPKAVVHLKNATMVYLKPSTNN